MDVQTYTEFEKLPLFYLGPPLEEKGVPTLLYLSLSGPESLTLAPYNQIANRLTQEGIRVLSLTLPGHHEGQDKHKAMEYWAHHLEELQAFLKNAHALLDHLFEREWIDSEYFAVAGLSRGGWIATHLLSHPQVKVALGLAPVTRLDFLSEFKEDSPLLKELSLELLLEKFVGKSLRYYIGNRDEKVGTANAFKFVEKLADFAFEKRVRSPEIELIISPSTGMLGHGTPPHIFEEAALWVKKKIVE